MDQTISLFVSCLSNSVKDQPIYAVFSGNDFLDFWHNEQDANDWCRLWANSSYGVNRSIPHVVKITRE